MFGYWGPRSQTEPSDTSLTVTVMVGAAAAIRVVFGRYHSSADPGD